MLVAVGSYRLVFAVPTLPCSRPRMRSRAVAAATSPAATRSTSRRCQHCGSSLLFIQRVFQTRHHKPPTATPTANSNPDNKTEMTLLPGRPMIAKCAYISFCACFGTLARFYTDDIGPASNVALQGSFLANSIGSFALGALASSPDRETIPDAMYAGLTVGFCGSYTTYSGWNLRIARGALGQVPGAPSGAIVTIVAMATSLAFFAACFSAGCDVMKQIESHGRRLNIRGMLGGGALAGGDSDAVRNTLGMLGAVYVLLVILLGVDGNWSRRIDWLACIFAPFGALSRFFLSRWGRAVCRRSGRSHYTMRPAQRVC
ncbi:unnamed protein product, partial [Ectocarpus sp. 12 AP-2014]